LEPVLAVIGAVRLRELDAARWIRALRSMAQSYSSAAVSKGNLALKRAIRFAAVDRHRPSVNHGKECLASPETDRYSVLNRVPRAASVAWSSFRRMAQNDSTRDNCGTTLQR